MSGGLFDDLDEQERTLLDRFWEYHRENPEVYKSFCAFADQAIAAGREYLGAKMLFERIRWYTTIEARERFPSGFKLNNNFHAFYARLWLREHPERPEFFELRRQRYEGASASPL